MDRAGVRTVVHYIDSAAFGGAETMVLTLLSGLDRRRWRPVLLYHPAPGLAPLLEGARRAGLELRGVPRGTGGSKLLRVLRLARALRAERPAVFHAHLINPEACKAGILAASMLRVPAVVASVQLFVAPSERAGLAPRLAALGVDRYVAVSEAVGRKARGFLSLRDGKLRVIRNGIPLERFDRPPDPALRQALLRGATRFLVLTPARLDEQKGLGYLIEAAASVPEATFLLAGEGPQRTALEEQARMLGLAERVVFLGRRDDVPGLLAACDLVVLPSLYEGFPLAVLEAAAAGRPVVATAVDGTAEAVRHGETGLLVPPADGAALARAIRRVLADPALAGRLGDAAKALARAEFSADAMVWRVTGLYDELLAPRGR